MDKLIRQLRALLRQIQSDSNKALNELKSIYQASDSGYEKYRPDAYTDASTDEKELFATIKALQKGQGSSDAKKYALDHRRYRLEWKGYVLSRFTAIFLLVYTTLTLIIAVYSIKSADAAKEAANAALKQANTNTKQFELAERPHVSVNIKLNQPVLIDRDGMRISVEADLTNNGPTPAFRTIGSATAIPLQIPAPEPKAIREQVCNEAKKLTTASKFTFPVYPAQQAPQKPQEVFGTLINRNDMEVSAKRNGGLGIVPFVAVCFAYRTTFDDSLIYTTAFVFQLLYIPDPHSQSRTMVPTQEGSLPIDRLDFFTTNHGGGPEMYPD